MNFNPIQSSRPQIPNQSKKPPTQYRLIKHQGLLPVSLKLLNKALCSKPPKIDTIDLTRVLAIARLEQLEPMTNKTVLTLNDNTAVVRIVRGKIEEEDELEIGEYYRFVIAVKEDKEEAVLLCERIDKVTTYQEIMFHWLRVANAVIERRKIKEKEEAQ